MAAGTTVDTTVDVEDDVEINSGSSTENQEEERGGEAQRDTALVPVRGVWEKLQEE